MAGPKDTLVVRLLKPEFEPILCSMFWVTGLDWRSALSLIGHAAAVVGQLGLQRLALGCLRPSYIFSDDDTVLVSCFGMSTRRFDDGTTQYSAPELQRDSECTPACDVYSLGLILAEQALQP